MHHPGFGLTLAHRQWALVLAGGDGTRLQELTRLIAGMPIPKQYCRIHAGDSLLEATLQRIEPLVPTTRTLVIVNNNHLKLAREQLTVLPEENILVQPHNRDTGPGLLFALSELVRRDPNAKVAVFPSDHYVGNPAVFRTHIERMAAVVDACPERISLLGIRPEWPEPGFGYIELGATLAVGHGSTAFAVSAFSEKPSPSAAAAIVARGGLWNSFVMMFRATRVLELVAAVRPSDVEVMQRLNADGRLRSDYHLLPRWNFSADFLVQIPQHLAVVEADSTRWSDWGTREAIERTFASLNQVPPWQLQPGASPHAVIRPMA